MNAEKYLPVGTICKIEGSSNRYVIIGFNSQELSNGEVNVYDYLGAIYPDGLASITKLSQFNHDDIISIDFIGYRTEESNKLSRMLNHQLNNVLPKQKYVFDKNGVLISDGNRTIDPEKYVKKQSNEIRNTVNPFYEKHDHTPVKASETSSNEWPIFNNKQNSQDQAKKYVFDKNGVLLSDGTNELKVKPTYKFDENGVLLSDGTNELKINPTYRFDENGVLLSDGKSELKDQLDNFKFDENGVLISDGQDEIKPVTPTYKFDVNGVLVSDGNTELKNQLDNFKFDENGVLISDGKDNVDNTIQSQGNNQENIVTDNKENTTPVSNNGYVFDENGVLIAEPTNENNNASEEEPDYVFDENGILIADNTEKKASNSTVDVDADGDEIDLDNY